MPSPKKTDIVDFIHTCLIQAECGGFQEFESLDNAVVEAGVDIQFDSDADEIILEVDGKRFRVRVTREVER